MNHDADSSNRLAPNRSRRLWRGVLVVLLILCGGLLGRWGWVQVSISRYASACLQAKDSGDWNALAQAAGHWAALDPQDERPLLYLAQAAEEQGDLKSAVDYLDRLPDDGAKTVPALVERSGFLFGPLNRPLEAVATCERILAIEPRTPDAHQRLIFFYAATLQREKLLQQARRQIEAGCDTPETFVYLLGADWINLSNGFDLNERWLAGNPEEELFLVAREIQFVRTHGVAEGDAGEAADASPTKTREKLLDEYLQRFPRNPELLAYHLDRCVTRGDVRRAAELLTQVPESAGGDNRFWRYKGWVHLMRNEAAEAEAAFRKALAIHPFDWSTQHHLASVLRKTGDLEGVERFSELALEGKELRKAIIQLPDVRTTPRYILLRMAAYAKHCGDDSVAIALQRHIAADQHTPAKK